MLYKNGDIRIISSFYFLWLSTGFSILIVGSGFLTSGFGASTFGAGGSGFGASTFGAGGSGFGASTFGAGGSGFGASTLGSSKPQVRAQLVLFLPLDQVQLFSEYALFLMLL